MWSRWSGSPWWLRVLCVLGIPWCVVLVALGVPFLVEPGPGLPLIWLGLVGLAPWGAVLTRR